MKVPQYYKKYNLHNNCVSGYSDYVQYDRSLTLTNRKFGDDLQRHSFWRSESTPECLNEKILATLARYVYFDPNDPVTLPPEWKVLTTATNDNLNNGYCGVAFVKYSTQQVVIAHRGLYLHTGSISSVINGVISSQYATQVCSAVTFVDMVRKEICKLRAQFINWTLTITGHSFGGWLGQVTGLTVMRLISENGMSFITAHPRDTVDADIKVFDSPGCYQMIKKICHDFNFNRCTLINFGRKIINVTLGPNVINLFGYQIGKQIEIITANYYKKFRGNHDIKKH